jgi:aspartyl-tRNA(Asn)/glutamyl-tRNA(Gln) amidotransferase subunit B
MDEGSFRCDVNVSVRKPGGELGTRCEIKNVNSIRFVQQAIEHEARRQVELIEEGGTVKQETRLFDANKGVTRPMRSKEHAHDYRYFPDPDLRPLVLDADWVEGIKATLPELPDAKKARFIKSYGLSAYNATVLVGEREDAAYYEALCEETKQLTGVPIQRIAVNLANWVGSDLFGALNQSGKSIQESPVTPKAAAELHALILDNTISGRIAKDVFAEMFATGKGAKAIVEEKGLRQVTDTGAIEAAIDKIMAEQADKVAEYRAGKDKLLGFFVGQVMKAMGGKANPAMLNELLKKKLAG